MPVALFFKLDSGRYEDVRARYKDPTGVHQTYSLASLAGVNQADISHVAASISVLCVFV